MLQQAEQVFPDLRNHIEEMEIATPITHMRYLGTPRGAIYGFEKHIKDSPVFLPNQMHIEGLFLAGGWVGGNGFQPTLESGFKTGQAVLRRLEINTSPRMKPAMPMIRLKGMAPGAESLTG